MCKCGKESRLKKLPVGVRTCASRQGSQMSETGTTIGFEGYKQSGLLHVNEKGSIAAPVLLQVNVLA